MGLQKTLTLDNGLSATDAYIRIDTVNGSKSNLTVSVNSYISQTAYTNGKSYLQQQFYTFTPSVADDAANFIKQGYVYLKTLNDFSGATDVLDTTTTDSTATS